MELCLDAFKYIFAVEKVMKSRSPQKVDAKIFDTSQGMHWQCYLILWGIDTLYYVLCFRIMGDLKDKLEL